MKLQHVRAMARKEWWHLLRDPRSLALILLVPSMLLFLLGYAVRLDLIETPIGILQEKREAISNELAARFDVSRAFHVARQFTSRRELTDAIQHGTVTAALVIPADFARMLNRGEARLQLVLDGVDANTARLVNNFARAIVDDFARTQTSHSPLIEVSDRMWFNETKESHIAIVPGIIAVVMAVIGALMTSLTIAREGEQGNLVMLRTTPLRRTEFLMGKLFPYFVIGMLDLLVATAAAVFLFDVPLRGSLASLMGVSAMFLLVVMLQGALISMVAGNQVVAAQMSLVSTFLPAFLLSGFVFAIENMPVALQYITLLVPARYYVALSKLIFLKGVSPLLIWSEVVILGAMTLLLLVAARRRAGSLGLLP